MGRKLQCSLRREVLRSGLESLIKPRNEAAMSVTCVETFTLCIALANNRLPIYLLLPPSPPLPAELPDRIDSRGTEVSCVTSGDDDDKRGEEEEGRSLFARNAGFLDALGAAAEFVVGFFTSTPCGSEGEGEDGEPYAVCIFFLLIRQFILLF